jgi:hypothetical protein
LAAPGSRVMAGIARMEIGKQTERGDLTAGEIVTASHNMWGSLAVIEISWVEENLGGR